MAEVSHSRGVYDVSMIRAVVLDANPQRAQSGAETCKWSCGRASAGMRVDENG